MRAMWLPLLGLAMQPATALAQAADLPVPVAASDHLPDGVRIRAVGAARVYVDRHGRTLYGMDMRAATGRTGRSALYCTGPCLAEWEPLRAPPGIVPIPVPRQFGEPRGATDKAPDAPPPVADNPDWTVMEGPAGPQWVYKAVHMVFTRKGDRPGSLAQDGLDDHLWNTLKYRPPVPTLSAPANVVPRLIGNAYWLADVQGNLLFSPVARDCAEPCAWQGFGSGMARRGVGEWTVRQTPDQAQWVYRGRPVYRASGGDKSDIPAQGVALHP